MRATFSFILLLVTIASSLSNAAPILVKNKEKSSLKSLLSSPDLFMGATKYFGAAAAGKYFTGISAGVNPVPPVIPAGKSPMQGPIPISKQGMMPPPLPPPMKAPIVAPIGKMPMPIPISKQGMMPLPPPPPMKAPIMPPPPMKAPIVAPGKMPMPVPISKQGMMPPPPMKAPIVAPVGKPVGKQGLLKREEHQLDKRFMRVMPTDINIGGVPNPYDVFYDRYMGGFRFPEYIPYGHPIAYN